MARSAWKRMKKAEESGKKKIETPEVSMDDDKNVVEEPEKVVEETPETSRNKRYSGQDRASNELNGDSDSEILGKLENVLNRLAANDEKISCALVQHSERIDVCETKIGQLDSRLSALENKFEDLKGPIKVETPKIKPEVKPKIVLPEEEKSIDTPKPSPGIKINSITPPPVVGTDQKSNPGIKIIPPESQKRTTGSGIKINSVSPGEPVSTPKDSPKVEVGNNPASGSVKDGNFQFNWEVVNKTLNIKIRY